MLVGRGFCEVKKVPTADYMEVTDAQLILGHAIFMTGKIVSLISSKNSIQMHLG